MKTIKYYTTILLLAGVFLSGLVYGLDRKDRDNERSLGKPSVLSSNNFDGNKYKIKRRGRRGRRKEGI